jgi:hypothetical protein
VQRGANFVGITLKLPGVSALNEDAQNNFESSLQGWYASIYEEDRRRRRRLQSDRLSPQRFQTRVLYADQSQDDQGVTQVEYDQSVTYVRPINEEDPDLQRILIGPFEDEGAVQSLVTRLKASDPFFGNLTGILEPPIVPEPFQKDDSDDSKLGLIIGVAAGGLVGLAAMVYFLFCRSYQKEDNIDMTKQQQDDDISKPEFSTEPSPKPVNVMDSSRFAGAVDRSRSISPRPGPDESDTPSLSSGGATRSQRTAGTTETGSWMVLGLESSTNDVPNAPPERPPPEFYEVVAPAGKLGVVIDTPTEGPPTVFDIKKNSPLLGQISIGDHLIRVDEEDVSTYSAVRVSKLIGEKAKNPQRKFLLTRQENA